MEASVRSSCCGNLIRIDLEPDLLLVSVEMLPQKLQCDALCIRATSGIFHGTLDCWPDCTPFALDCSSPTHQPQSPPGDGHTLIVRKKKHDAVQYFRGCPKVHFQIKIICQKCKWNEYIHKLTLFSSRKSPPWSNIAAKHATLPEPALK